MNGAQKIGALYRISNQISPLLLFLSVLTNAGLALLLAKKEPPVSSNVIAYDKNVAGELGVPIRLECESGSEGRRREAIQISAALMKILYEYEQGEKEEYVAKYKNFFPFIAKNSDAERILRSSVEKRSKDLLTDTSTFTLDYKKTGAVAVGRVMNVAVTGTRKLTTTKGSLPPQTIKLDLEFRIGEDDASFALFSVTERK